MNGGSDADNKNANLADNDVEFAKDDEQDRGVADLNNNIAQRGFTCCCCGCSRCARKPNPRRRTPQCRTSGLEIKNLK